MGLHCFEVTEPTRYLDPTSLQIRHLKVVGLEEPPDLLLILEPVDENRGLDPEIHLQKQTKKHIQFMAATND